jgi:hypothetical protein
MDTSRSLFVIDALDRVCFMSAGALELVRGCGGGAWLTGVNMGRRIWDSIAGFENQQLLELLYDRVRAVGAPLHVRLRCDSNDMRRRTGLQLEPLPDSSIRHWIELQWSELRAQTALLDPQRKRDARSLNCCTWCKSVQLGMDAWREVEEAESLLGLSGESTLPRLRASVCTACKQELLQTFPDTKVA